MIATSVVWQGLCRSLGCPQRLADEAWTAIATAYAEPWRRYHTLDHIGTLLALRRQHTALFGDVETVDLAIFLHDVVYEPSRSDNEARSAEWARSRLPALGIEPARIVIVADYIERSRHDAASLAGIDPGCDLALFLDLDLSVLAAEPAAYADYASAVRAEYAIYPDLLYRPGRAKVLRGFLARPTIYCSASFHPAWEARARANIAAEIATLTT